MNALQTQLCGLPAELLQEAERLFLTQLDFSKLFTVTDQSDGGTEVWQPRGLSRVFDLCLCSLSERAADGQRWRPEERQPGRDLGLQGAGRPHRWCEETLDVIHPLDVMKPHILKKMYLSALLACQKSLSQFYHLSLPNLLFFSALLALQLHGDERCSPTAVHREQVCDAPRELSCFFKDCVWPPWRGWRAHPIAQLVRRQWHQVIFREKWTGGHRSGPWQQH